MNIAVRQETTVDYSDEKALETLSNEDYISIIEAKTKINSKILNILNNDNLSKDHKSLLINMLSDNANQSSLLLKIVRDNTIEGVDLDKIFLNKNKQSNKLMDKFKNMFVGFKSDFSPSTFFRNNKLPNWKEIGEISVLNIKPTFLNMPFVKNFTEFLTSNIDNTKVFVKQNNHNIYLIGQKYKIKKLYKEYQDIFSLLSVNPNEFLLENTQKEYNEKQLISDINQHLVNKLSMSFNSTNNSYDFNLLNGLNDTLKYEMISTIIAPEIVNQLSKNYQVRESLEKERNNNKYISMVNDFASTYNLNPFLVIHSIKEDSKILESYSGFDKLQKNKDNILTANTDYELLLKKNLVYINELLIAKTSLIETAENIKIDNQIKTSFIKDLEERNLSSQEHPVLLKDFETNVTKMIDELNIVPIHNKSLKVSKKQ